MGKKDLIALRTNKVPQLQEIMSRKLIFVCGKGGVGKTLVSRSLALALAELGKKTLWVTFEDPNYEIGNDHKNISTSCWHLNCDASKAFEEYAVLKISLGPLSRLFLHNKLVQYLAKAAPGIHELVLLGKVWYERNHYDSVIIDMPSTGHGLAMFQSTKSFTVLFKGGPIQKDAEAMLETFGNPNEAGYMIVALPEEMPLRESLELNSFLLELFPGNPPAFLVNRLFPKLFLKTISGKEGQEEGPVETPDSWSTPIALSAEDYLRKKSILENFNLRIWRELGISFGELGLITSHRISEGMVAALGALIGQVKGDV